MPMHSVNRIRTDQDRILAVLGDGGEASVTDIANATGISPARATKLLDALERMRLVYSAVSVRLNGRERERVYWAREPSERARPCASLGASPGPIRRLLNRLALAVLLGVAAAICVATLLGYGRARRAPESCRLRRS